MGQAIWGNTAAILYEQRGPTLYSLPKITLETAIDPYANQTSPILTDTINIVAIRQSNPQTAITAREGATTIPVYGTFIFMEGMGNIGLGSIPGRANCGYGIRLAGDG